MYTHQNQYILSTVTYNTTKHFLKANVARLRAAQCDAALTQDDSYDDDLLGNDIFCHDYAVKH